MRPGKRGGAFCAYTVPSHHPYLLLNWTSKRRDVLTLAHELGHGIHAYLSRPQGVFHQRHAADPGRDGIGVRRDGDLRPAARPGRPIPADRLPLLAEHLEGQIATVFRQVAMWRFEDRVHTARRTEGELSVDASASCGTTPSTRCWATRSALSDGYRTWWSYIPHFIHTPGYVYAYAYGQLLALSVYARYEAEGASFVPSYLELLSAGGSMAPEELGKIVGVDLADPGFWDAGLDIIERQLTATLDTATAAGRLGARLVERPLSPSGRRGRSVGLAAAFSCTKAIWICCRAPGAARLVLAEPVTERLEHGPERVDGHGGLGEVRRLLGRWIAASS